MSDTPVPELNSGDFVRIVWPNGSELGGFIHISSNGTVALNFGPERADVTRWITLGFVGRLHDFVKLGSLQVVPTQRSLF